MVMFLLLSVNPACYLTSDSTVVPLVILGGCMIFLSPFLYVIKMPMLTVFFLTQLHCGFLCLQNTILWPTIQIALGLQLISTLYPWSAFLCAIVFCLHLFLVTPSLLMLVELCVWWITLIKSIRKNYHWCHEYFKQKNSFWERTKIKYNWYLCLPIVIFDYY